MLALQIIIVCTRPTEVRIRDLFLLVVTVLMFSCLPLSGLCLMWLFPCSYSLDLLISDFIHCKEFVCWDTWMMEAMELTSLELDFHFTIDYITLCFQDRNLTLSAWKHVILRHIWSLDTTQTSSIYNKYLRPSHST